MTHLIALTFAAIIGFLVITQVRSVVIPTIERAVAIMEEARK